MIAITKSPVYSVSSADGTYDFNVCAGYSNPTFELLTYDLDVLSIASAGEQGGLQALCSAASASVAETIRSALSAQGGTAPTYLYAELNGSGVYDGAYALQSVTSGSSSTVALILSGLDGSSAWTTNVPAAGEPVGRVRFLFGETVSAKFEYRKTTTWLPSVEVALPVRRNGETLLAFGEVYKGLFTDSVSLRATVERTSILTTEPESVSTGTVICTPSQYWGVNYGDLTLLNAKTGGKGLPTSGPSIWVDPAQSKVMPCYANFVLNDGELDNFTTTLLALIVRFYKGGEEVALRLVGVPIKAGLNSVELSSQQEVADTLLKYKPEYVDVFSKFYTFSAGEFDAAEFESGQWITEFRGEEVESEPIRMQCHYRVMDDRRGCYLVFPNGIGGISNAYTEDFKRTVEPQTVGLRSGTQIGSTVVRETETLTCVFDQLTPAEYASLTGYDPRSARKVNGIEEAALVTRVLADGTRIEYIPTQQNVQVDNQKQYYDASITLYRAL